jgi:hypothetical protein
MMVHVKGIKKDKMKEYKRECVLVDSKVLLRGTKMENMKAFC